MKLKNKISTQGERLRFARAILGATRSYICEKYNIPEVTLKSWEKTESGLTDKAIKKCIELYMQEGIILNFEWLQTGVGLEPKSVDDISSYFSKQDNTSLEELAEEDEDIAIIRDANLFRDANKDAIIMLVSSMDMMPFYNVGDYVGGKLQKPNDSLIGKDCIIILNDHTKYLRRIFKTPDGKYNAACINPSISPKLPVLYDIQIKEIAPVIWHRKRKTY